MFMIHQASLVSYYHGGLCFGFGFGRKILTAMVCNSQAQRDRDH